MNPFIVIATHQRFDLTNELIHRIFREQKNCKIVLVVSDIIEYTRFKQIKSESLFVTKFENKPLGLKWQHGVSTALQLGADPVIILGSDDMLSPNFVNHACGLLSQGYDFIGFKRYYVLRNKKKFTIDYKPEQPIGGGRVYSAKLLKHIGGKIFAPLDRKLDDYGWNQVLKSQMKYLLIKDLVSNPLSVTAIKGSWKMMNPFNQYHPNLHIVCVE